MEAAGAVKTTAAPVLLQPGFRRRHVFQAVGAVVGIHLELCFHTEYNISFCISHTDFICFEKGCFLGSRLSSYSLGLINVVDGYYRATKYILIGIS